MIIAIIVISLYNIFALFSLFFCSQGLVHYIMLWIEVQNFNDICTDFHYTHFDTYTENIQEFV